MARSDSSPPIPVERVQTGVRLEKRMLKVLRALAEHKEVSLSDLLEGIVLHALEGKTVFSAETLKVVEKLRAIYGLELGAEAAHRMSDQPQPRASEKRVSQRAKRSRE
jgi:hypothetical protein